jgi:hypothetical protein
MTKALHGLSRLLPSDISRASCAPGRTRVARRDRGGPDCRKRDTVLATVKDAARRLRRWPKRAILDRGLRAASLGKGRSGRKNGPGVEQKN